MAPPHFWQPDERDALEILSKEYDLDATREDDVFSIFTTRFGWTPDTLTRLRDEWRGRFKAGRSPTWRLNHSKANIGLYTPR